MARPIGMSRNDAQLYRVSGRPTRSRICLVDESRRRRAPLRRVRVARRWLSLGTTRTVLEPACAIGPGILAHPLAPHENHPRTAIAILDRFAEHGPVPAHETNEPWQGRESGPGTRI